MKKSIFKEFNRDNEILIERGRQTGFLRRIIVVYIALTWCLRRISGNLGQFKINFLLVRYLPMMSKFL